MSSYYIFKLNLFAIINWHKTGYSNVKSNSCFFNIQNTPYRPLGARSLDK
jgi:hypothetical protein